MSLGFPGNGLLDLILTNHPETISLTEVQVLEIVQQIRKPLKDYPALLNHAIKKDWLNLMWYLLRKRCEGCEKAVEACIKAGNIEFAGFLIDNHYDIISDECGFPLHAAIEVANLPLVKKMLDEFQFQLTASPLSRVNPDHLTPLGMAIAYQLSDITIALVEAGADVNKFIPISDRSQSPWYVVLTTWKNPDVNVVLTIIRHGLNIHKKYYQDVTIFNYAITLKNRDHAQKIVAAILEQGEGNLLEVVPVISKLSDIDYPVIAALLQRSDLYDRYELLLLKKLPFLGKMRLAERLIDRNELDRAEKLFETLDDEKKYTAEFRVTMVEFTKRRLAELKKTLKNRDPAKPIKPHERMNQIASMNQLVNWLSLAGLNYDAKRMLKFIIVIENQFDKHLKNAQDVIPFFELTLHRGDSVRKKVANFGSGNEVSDLPVRSFKNDINQCLYELLIIMLEESEHAFIEMFDLHSLNNRVFVLNANSIDKLFPKDLAVYRGEHIPATAQITTNVVEIANIPLHPAAFALIHGKTQILKAMIEKSMIDLKMIMHLFLRDPVNPENIIIVTDTFFNFVLNAGVPELSLFLLNNYNSMPAGDAYEAFRNLSSERVPPVVFRSAKSTCAHIVLNGLEQEPLETDSEFKDRRLDLQVDHLIEARDFTTAKQMLTEEIYGDKGMMKQIGDTKLKEQKLKKRKSI